MTESKPLATPFTGHEWVRMWARTASLGTGILAAVFVSYELAERLWLKDVYGNSTLFAFHIYRGVGAAILLASWTFYNIWRLRRRYDDAFGQAFRQLEAAMSERTQALQKAQAFTERLFDSLRDRLLVVDAAGTVVKANRVAVEAALGNPAGKACTMLSGACAPGDGCVALQAITTGLPVIGQCVRPDPRTGRLFAIDAYPVAGGDGRPEVAIEVARDITESKQLETQLRNQEKLAALGVLAAGIAHDIANPLASMSSELELLEEERDLARVHESAAVLREHVARINRTLREMTEFARRRTEEMTDVPVHVAVEDALRMIRHDPRARSVRFETVIPAGLPRVRIVEDHLVMVLVNLILNALDAMPDGGRLELRAEAVGEHVRLSVSDTGTGMTEEVLRRAKEPLFTTKPGRGTGLGLSIAADVLRVAGGSLDIDSTPGVGTTVHLSCPTVPNLMRAHG